MSSAKYILACLCFIMFLNGCKVYSFSGANIDPNISSISIAYFQNESNNGPASVSDQFTQDLKDKMLNNTNLALVNNNGDVRFEGNIIGYNYSIQAPTGGESSDLRRITMTVKVNFINQLNEEDSWESTFTRFAEYPVNESLADVEERLITEINTLLVDDIFNKAFVKW